MRWTRLMEHARQEESEKKRRDKKRAPSQTIQEAEAKQGYSAAQPVGTKNVFILIYHSSQRSDKQPILPWLHPAKTCK